MITAALILLLLPIVALLWLQHSMIYHPRRYTDDYARLLPPGSIELAYKTAAGNQLAFYVPVEPNNAALPSRLWITFSGNASVALDWLYLIRRYPARGDGFLLVDYAGYGKSAGRASIASTRASAEKALETLAAKLDVPASRFDDRLNVIGQSLGAAAALDFAVRHPIDRALLISPFTSMRDVAALLVGRPLSYVLLENYDNRARLQELAARDRPPHIAIFHGTADSLIPISMSKDLVAGSRGIATLFPVAGADHNDTVGPATAEIIAWMDSR
jgi:pimeloyl-ACP methyl ester carboxylesterase